MTGTGTRTGTRIEDEFFRGQIDRLNRELYYLTIRVKALETYSTMPVRYKDYAKSLDEREEEAEEAED